MKLGFISAGGSATLVERGVGSGPTLLERLRLRGVATPHPADPGAGVPDEPGPGTFQLFDRLRFIDALVAIFADDTAEARRMKAQIEEVGGTAMLIPQRDVPEEWLRTYAHNLTCCIVGHDFDEAGGAAEYCLRLRLIAPDLPIILTLPGTATHDFRPSGQPVCDARLRRPVSRTPLLLGIQAACDSRVARPEAPHLPCARADAAWPRIGTAGFGAKAGH